MLPLQSSALLASYVPATKLCSTCAHRCGGNYQCLICFGRTPSMTTDISDDCHWSLCFVCAFRISDTPCGPCASCVHSEDSVDQMSKVDRNASRNNCSHHVHGTSSTPPILKKLTFRTATRSVKYNFDLLLLQKYLSNSGVYIFL
jgi:hypothetical protein